MPTDNRDDSRAATLAPEARSDRFAERRLVGELRAALGDESVRDDPAEMLVYESDGFTITKSIPAAVVFPRTVEQVVVAMNILARHDAQIVPRGSGTGLAGGCVAFDRGVIVSTVKLNRVLSVDLDSRVAHAQAGVRNVQLSEHVAALPGGSGYHFAPDPSSQKASTVGGNAATNAGGIHTLKDFVSSNHVLGVELVTPDGEVLRLGAAGESGGCFESPAGFDLPALVCGSEGTLGIITALWLRLTPKATAYRTATATFDTQDAACKAVSAVIAAGHLPAALEMLDGRMVQLVEETFHLGIPATARALVLCELDGVDELLDGQMADVVAIFEQHGSTGVETSADAETRTKLWKARKAAFGAIGKISPSYCTQDACVPRSTLAEVLAKVDQIGRDFGLTINNVFHAGDGNVHPIFLYDDRDPAQVLNVLHAAEKVLQTCIDLGGTVTGEHGVGVEKLHLMPYLFDAATMNQFQQVKLAFDPGERINAGKLLPSDKVNTNVLAENGPTKPGRKVPQ